MKRLLCTLGLLFSMAAHALPFQELVVFGGSYSDNGNTYLGPAYSLGRKTLSAWGGACLNPSGHFFYGPIHPTTHAHYSMSQDLHPFL